MKSNVQIDVTLTEAPTGWDWRVSVGASVYQGWDGGSHNDAWRAVNLIVTGLLRRMPETTAEEQLAAFSDACASVLGAPVPEHFAGGSPGPGAGDTAGRCISCNSTEPEVCGCR